MVNASTQALTHIGVAFTFGLIITVMIAATGHLSGAHFNPAVTLAFALTRHFPWRDVPLYIGSQLMAAIAGALTLRRLLGPVADLGVTVPQGSVGQAFGLEVLLTAVLMFVITAVATDTRAVGPRGAGDWRDGGPRRAVGRTNQRCLDEPGPVAGACARGWRLAGSMGLCAGAVTRGRPWCRVLPVLARAHRANNG
jgi:hypothetical protein